MTVSPAQMDTTEYPPEGQAEVHCGSEVSTTREVCDHADLFWNVRSSALVCLNCGEKL